jgi:hypothetical protein
VYARHNQHEGRGNKVGQSEKNERKNRFGKRRFGKS